MLFECTYDSSLSKARDVDPLLGANKPIHCATIVTFVRSPVKQNLDKGLLRMFIHVVSGARDSSGAACDLGVWGTE